MEPLKVLKESILNAYQDIRLNMEKAIIYGIAFGLISLVQVIPVVGGLLWGYLLVKLLERIANQKATKFAYLSAMTLGLLQNIVSFLIFLLPRNNIISFILSLVSFALYIILIPQIFFGLFGREKFDFTVRDLLFYGLSLLLAVIIVPVAAIVGVVVLYALAINKVLGILLLLTAGFIIFPLLAYLGVKAQIEIAKALKV